MSGDNDDFQTFLDELGPVRRIRSNRVEKRRSRAEPHPRMREADEQTVLDELTDLHPDDALLETGEELLWTRPGLQKRVLTRLRRGRWQVQDEIDLHQMNVEAATSSIRIFLEQTLAANRRCVKIIHGKGLRSGPEGPRLKSVCARVLSRHPMVLAFASARAADGGTGAVYVLLKNRR